MNKQLILTLAMTLAGSAVAADNGWSGEGQLGLTYARGNAETDVINMSLNMKKEAGQWLHEAGVFALRSENNGVINAKRYEIKATSGYKFDENDYLSLSVRYDRDSFSGFDYTYTMGGAWGHTFYQTTDHHLITELGVGYKKTAIDIDRSSESEAVALGKLDYLRKLTETVDFSNVLIVETGSSNTFFQNDAGFSFKVNETMSVKLAHQWRHNTDPASGSKKTDTLLSVNLVYGF